LILNDDWVLASRLGFDGVHLGQEDLNEAAPYFAATVRQLMLVGISVHSLDEIRRAIALAPDYIAFGPLFPSSTKSELKPLPTPEQVDCLRLLRREFRGPIIGIGGIDPKHAPAAVDLGVDCLAFEAWGRILAHCSTTPEECLSALNLVKNLDLVSADSHPGA
jgi:thiamine-phosphate pyrophosphorylase